jgi:anti-sigma factor RsiW
MNVTCSIARMRMPDLDSDRQLSGRLGRHTQTCLRCQAETARYRSLQRRLRHLSSEIVVAPEGIPEAVIREIGAPPVAVEAAASRSRIRTVVTMAAASAAMAATAGTVAAVGWWRFRVVA